MNSVLRLARALVGVPAIGPIRPMSGPGRPGARARIEESS